MLRTGNLLLQCVIPFIVICASGYWLATQGFQPGALPDAAAAKPQARAVIGSLITSCVVGLAYVPFLVACHSLVLFGREHVGTGLHFKFARTERRLLWASLRLMALGFVVLTVVGFIGGLIVVLLPIGKVISGFIVAALTIFATIAYLALTVLIVPVVVVDDLKPVRTAFRLALQNKMLMVMFMIIAFVLRLIISGVASFIGRQVPIKVGEVYVTAVALTSGVTVLGTAFGALMLSLVFLKVRGAVIPASPDPVLAPL